MQTPSQTVGPFFGIGLIGEGQNHLVDNRTAGERIRLEGTVFDGDGRAVSDAMVEIWQADSAGIFNHPADPRREEADPHFCYFGRSGTDDEGRYWFNTVKPGSRAAGGGTQQAPYINVRVFARGMLIHAVTRIYFSDEPTNSSDPVLNAVEEARRATLIGRLSEASDPPAYQFDIHLQGEGETVFFNP